MRLNHFADSFQNDHASVDQFFSESNNLTEQYNPEFGANNGYGFAQNTAGYEWGDDSSLSKKHMHSRDMLYDSSAMGHHHEITNGGMGSAGAMCGADPQSMARMNLEWENHMTHGHGMGSGQHIHNVAAQSQQEVSVPEYVYQGPDDLEFDDEDVAPKKGMEYWKKRISTLLIHGITVAVWIWLWSSFGFSKMLPGTAGSVLYWGFILLMGFGVFQSDHRCARYDEEREVLTSVESKLKTLVKLAGAAATMMLTFKLVKGKSAAVQYGVNSALAISFFIALAGMISFTAKKRGETVRRYRKVKSAGLNLSIGLLAVAALLTLGLGTTSSVQLGGGNGGAKKAEPVVIDQEVKVRRNISYEDVMTPPPAPVQAAGAYDAYGGGAGMDPRLAGLAPIQAGGGAYIGGAPTVVDPAYSAIANTGGAVAPTVLQ